VESQSPVVTGWKALLLQVGMEIKGSWARS